MNILYGHKVIHVYTCNTCKKSKKLENYFFIPFTYQWIENDQANSKMKKKLGLDMLFVQIQPKNMFFPYAYMHFVSQERNELESICKLILAYSSANIKISKAQIIYICFTLSI